MSSVRYNRTVVDFRLRQTTIGYKQPIRTFGGNYEIHLPWVL